MNQKSDKIRKIKDASILIGLVCLGVLLYIHLCYKNRIIDSPLEPACALQYPDKTPQKPTQEQEAVALSNLDESCNAAFGYKKAISMLTDLPDDFGKQTRDVTDNGWGEDNEELKDLLIKNQAAIRKFKKAANLPKCDFLYRITLEEYLDKHSDESLGALDALDEYDECLVSIETLRKYGDLAHLVILEGRLFETEGKPDDALENYVSALKYTIHLSQEKTDVLMSRLYERLTLKRIYTPLCQFINHENVNKKQCNLLLDTLISLRKNRIDLERVSEQRKKGFTRVIQKVIQMMVDEVKQYKAYDPIFYRQFYLEFNKLHDEFYKYQIAGCRQNSPEKCRQTKEQMRERLLKETTLRILVWNFAKRRLGLEATNPATLSAKILYSEHLRWPSLPASLITSHYKSVSEWNILTTATAVKLYELEKGKAPENLEELVPKYLSELPKDPFDEFKLLKYKRKNDKEWTLYSLGPDKKDSNGEIISDGSDSSKDAIVFSSSDKSI